MTQITRLHREQNASDVIISKWNSLFKPIMNTYLNFYVSEKSIHSLFV